MSRHLYLVRSPSSRDRNLRTFRSYKSPPVVKLLPHALNNHRDVVQPLSSEFFQFVNLRPANTQRLSTTIRLLFRVYSPNAAIERRFSSRRTRIQRTEWVFRVINTECFRSSAVAATAKSTTTAFYNDSKIARAED